MTNNIKKAVQRFRSEFGIGSDVTLDSLRSALKKQGYTIIEYNNIVNEENVAALIDALDLEQLCGRSKGFTYADQRWRLVFLHEDLSEREKLMVLAHEEGHIYCSHLSSVPVIGTDVTEEHEANEFAHYLLYQGKWQQLCHSLLRHKRAIIAAVVIVGILIGGCFIFSAQKREHSYYGEFYITATGNKYHRADCIFIRDKTTAHRMTKVEFESGKYEPCGICLPDADAS